jgi:hypothetical protein
VAAVALFILLVLAVAILARRARRSRIQVRTCCSAQPWPPDDLTSRDHQ